MKIRFAVVDDAAFLRELIKNIMTSQGATCVGEAADGIEAVDLIDRTLPDLVFLDMVMPQQNGIETARAIKSRYPEIKIVGCSTVDQESIIENAFDVGFDAYLSKPFSKEQLITEVKKVLSK